MKREKVKFYVERDSFGVEACVIFRALSVAFRIIGFKSHFRLSVRFCLSYVLPCWERRHCG